MVFLLPFLTSCAHKQNGGLLFLLLTRGRDGGTETLGVKGEEKGKGEGDCHRRCSLGLSVTLHFSQMWFTDFYSRNLPGNS